MKRITLCLLMAAPALGVAAADWPQFTGPNGNFTMPALTTPLVDDAGQARLLWESEERELPAAKLYIQNKLPRPSGGMQSLVVADGRVIFAYMMPSGDDLANEKTGNGGCPLDRKLVSDDTILAVDCKTGKTLWKRVFAGQGYYLPPTKRGGFGVTPAVWQGTVYWLGGAGRLYAVNAATGELRWQVEVEPLFAQQKADAEKSRQAGKRGFKIDEMLSSLVVADGTLIVPVFTARGGDIGVAGYEPATGKRLWELPAVLSPKSTPATWRHEGREYLLCGSLAGALRLVEPRTGKVLWTFKDGLAPLWEQLAPWNDTVLLPQPSATARMKRYAAFRLSVAGAEKLWELPDAEPFLEGLEGDGRAVRRVTPAGERCYLNTRTARDVTVLELSAKDGRLLRKSTGLRGCWANITTDLGGGRLLYTGDAEHYHTGYPDFALIATDGPELKLLGRQWQPFRRMEGATAYEVPHIYYLDEGRLYLRTSMGVLRCYDLRAAK
jgi:outer membrane protein assembly factor BamB